MGYLYRAMRKVHVCIAIASLIALPVFAGDKCDKSKQCAQAAKAPAHCSAKAKEGCSVKKAGGEAKGCCPKAAAKQGAAKAPNKGAEGLSK